VTPAAARSALRRQIAQHGEAVTVRRYAGTGEARSSADYATTGRVTGYLPDQLVGNLKQGDRKVILAYDDLAATAITLPLLLTDKLVLRGKEFVIKSLDDNTRRLAGELIAYEVGIAG